MPPSRRGTSTAYAAFFLLFFSILLVSHAGVLDLPYFWDELGQFVPAALDIFEHRAWVPVSTLPNVHPPGVMAYLAAFWTVTGYSVTATRIAMLLLAAAGVLAVFALAIHLCRPLPGQPAFLAAALLLASPLFWAQSMMAQLDMPAMGLTTLALLLFFTKRYLLCAAACTLLVLAKETSIVVPAAFGAILLWERRFWPAMLFFAPAAALAAWLAVLYSTTGHILGNQEFTHYNIWFQLHPVRLPLTVLRRLFYIFIDNFHWIGTIAMVVAWRRTQVFRTREWAVVGTIAVLQTAVVSVLGGAALERYILPVVPLFYIAVAAAFTTVARVSKRTAATAMMAGLVAAIFLRSPFPYPFENNAAFVSFVRLQEQAAEFVASEYPTATIVSAWPFPDALRRPEFGYVPSKMSVRGLANFDPETVRALGGDIDVLVLYSRTWEPRWGVFGMEWIRRLLTNYYYYQPQITGSELRDEFGLTRIARWERQGQWIEVYARQPIPSIRVM